MFQMLWIQSKNRPGWCLAPLTVPGGTQDEMPGGNRCPSGDLRGTSAEVLALCNQANISNLVKRGADELINI